MQQFTRLTSLATDTECYVDITGVLCLVPIAASGDLPARTRIEFTNGKPCLMVRESPEEIFLRTTAVKRG